MFFNNAVAFAAIGSSSTAIMAVIFQYRNIKDTLKTMSDHIKISKSSLDLSEKKLLIGLRPWIYMKLDKEIKEYNFSKNVTRISMHISNFGILLY